MADIITLNISQSATPFALAQTTDAAFVLTQATASNVVNVQLGASLTGSVSLVGPSSIKGFESYAAGNVGDNELILLNVVPYTFTVSVPDSMAYALTPPTASAVFTIKRIRGGVLTTIGTVTFAANSNNGVIAFTDAALIKHDVLLIYAPSPSDATLADISFLLAE